MRLIDADAFADYIKKASLDQKYEDLKIDGLLTVADVLDAVVAELDGSGLDGYKNAPTIEPQRTGRWIDHVEDGYVECPFCHSATNCDDNISELHFCFSCGARMEGEVTE